MANSVEPDEMAHFEQSHQDLRCCLGNCVVVISGHLKGFFSAISFKGDNFCNFLLLSCASSPF